MSQYFSKPYQPFGGDITVKVDLSNHATKVDLKYAIVTDETCSLKPQNLFLLIEVN